VEAAVARVNGQHSGGPAATLGVVSEGRLNRGHALVEAE
jgi:hypothetical protein